MGDLERQDCKSMGSGSMKESGRASRQEWQNHASWGPAPQRWTNDQSNFLDSSAPDKTQGPSPSHNRESREEVPNGRN